MTACQMFPFGSISLPGTGAGVAGNSPLSPIFPTKKNTSLIPDTVGSHVARTMSGCPFAARGGRSNGERAVAGEPTSRTTYRRRENNYIE